MYIYCLFMLISSFNELKINDFELFFMSNYSKLISLPFTIAIKFSCLNQV